MKIINYIACLLLFSLIHSLVIEGNNIKNALSETIDEEIINLDGEYEKNITLKKDNNIRYIFNIQNSEYIYIFESDIDGYIHYNENISCPNFCVVQQNQSIHDNIVYINYYQNATEKEINIKISSKKDFEGEIKSIKSNDYKIDAINPITSLKSILIFQSYIDYISYQRAIDESISIKCAIYEIGMTISDILDINYEYFRNCNNGFSELKTNRIYILSIVSESYNKPFEMLLQPKVLNNIEITELNDFLYLSYQVENYTLNFNQNKGIQSIALSRLSINSEINIQSSEANESIVLNKDNLYYVLNNEKIFNGNLTIKVTKGDGALIEFLSKFEENDVTILTEKEYNNYNIKNEAILIKFNNNHKNKFININILSKDNKEISFTMVSGFAKGNFYHNSLSNQLSNLYQKNTYSTEIKIYNEGYDLEEGEYFYLFLTFQKEEISDESYNILLNKIDKFSTDDLNVYISEEKCKLVIENLKKLFEDAYIYTEIKKNPPNPEYFKPADLISDLNNIKTKDRKYYDFYRDIQRIFGKTRDGHLAMKGNTSPNGYDLKLFVFCLPFYFRIGGNNATDAKIYIEKYPPCFPLFNDEQQKFVENHIGKYVKSINKTDPFEFIQNFGNEFNSFYNKHSTFTMKINSGLIQIRSQPLTSQELSNIEFVFEGEEPDINDSINLDYYFYYEEPKKNNEELLSLFNIETKKNFKIKNPKSILDFKYEFYNRKNLENKNINEDEIKWDFKTIDKDESIKCRFDEKNNLNVFKQSSFYFLGDEYNNAIEVVENCTELFYSNPYPIVGIESLNGGGVCKLSYYFQELLQAKILPVHHISIKLSKIMQEYVEADIPIITTDPDMYQRIDIETCKPFSKFEDMKEIVDDYGNGVTHHRSQYFGIFNSTDLKNHKKRRQKYFNMNNLKRPTDIIIFTDSYSFSATSFFIKGLQETGGAIAVGYLGNPKSEEIFDASQAPSFVGDLSNSEISSNLLKCGFQLSSVTIYESYNYTYQVKNPTPRDYLIHPVDERVPIYQVYSDSIYNNFMEEAKKIFKKYNEDQECNPNNLDLLYDPNNKEDCYTFENDPHAHGGYECDNSTKKWSKTCKPYYCDIGYYFDKYQNKCIKDICTEDNENDDDKDKKKDDDKGGIKAWHIILIVVGSLLILIIILIIILKCRKPQEIESTGETGPLIDQVELKEN